MGSREIILRMLAKSLDRRLIQSDFRKSQRRIVSTPAAVVNNVITALSAPQTTCRKQNFQKELCRVLICAVSHRYKMPIREMYIYCDTELGKTGTYLCPRCGSAIEFDFQAYCGSCGQAIDWHDYKNVTIRRHSKRNCESVKQPASDSSSHYYLCGGSR